MNVKWSTSENLATPWATVKTETGEVWIDYSALDRILNDPSATDDSKAMVRIVQSAILAEREACAKDLEQWAESYDMVLRGTIHECVDRIRARSNAPETEKEIIVQMPPKSRQAGFYTINDY